MGNIEPNLKLLVNSNCKFGKKIINFVGNDMGFHQSEMTNNNIESVCTCKNHVGLTFSGPLPNLTSDDIFSHMSSLNHGLSVRVC